MNQRLNERFFNKKITFLLDFRYSCARFLIKNTCNGHLFLSICRIHVFLLKYSSGKFSLLVPHKFFQNRYCLSLTLGMRSCKQKTNYYDKWYYAPTTPVCKSLGGQCSFIDSGFDNKSCALAESWSCGGYNQESRTIELP